MSIGRLVVELELRDGQYHARMRRATDSARALDTQFGRLDKRLRSIEGGLSGTVPHLRDIAIITASLHSVLSTVNDTMGDFVRSLINSNAEIERSGVLLQGLSDSIDTDGKLADSGRDMKFLFDTAKEAPFALKELTNSFVKMRVAGIDDVENKIRNLTDALANFGGDDQALHRATVAIQQMASKGVISMEELRQQLGESVPGAMSAMADGMGLTMQTLVKKISEGRVKALPAINAMMLEMEFTMEGSSRRMMETWTGMVSQLQTNWMLLQKVVGDAGFFKEIKDGLEDINKLLQSDEALKYAQAFGDGVASAIRDVKELTTSFTENKDAILSAGEALLALWASYKSISLAKSIIGGGAGFLDSIVKENKRFQREISNIFDPRIDISKKFMGIEYGLRQGRIQTSAWTKAVQLLGAAFSWLTGPIGAVGIAVAVVASQFIDFESNADKAKRALEGIIEKQRELNSKGVRTPGDAALKTNEDIEKAKQDIKELEKLLEEKQAKLNDARLVGFMGRKSAPGDTANSLAGNKEIEQLKSEVELVRQAIAEGTQELFDRTLERETAQIRKSIEDRLVARTTEYKRSSDLIKKGIEERSKAEKKSRDDIDKITHSAMLKLHKDEIEGRIKLLEEEKAVALKTFEEIQRESPQISAIISLEEEKARLEAQKIMIVGHLAEIESNIAKSSDENEKKRLIGDMDKDRSSLAKINDSIKETLENISKLKSSDKIDENDIVKYASGKSALDIINEKLERLSDNLRQVNSGKIVEDYEMFSDSDKQADKLLEKAKQRADQLASKLASVSDEYLKAQSKTYNKLAVKTGDDISETLRLAFEKIKTDDSASPRVKQIMENARVLLNIEPSEESIDAYNQISIDRAQAIDEVLGEASATKQLNEELDRLAKKRDELARERAVVDNGGIDPISTPKSANTIDLERLIKEAENVGRDTETLRRALETSLQSDAYAAQIEGAKKTASELQRIRQEEIQRVIQKEDFIADIEMQINDEMLRSKLELNQDSAALYQADTDEFVRQLERRAIEHGIVLDEELKKLIETNRAKYEEIRGHNARVRVLENERALGFDLRRGSINRSRLTDRQKDLLIAGIDRDQEIERIKSDTKGRSQFEIASDIEIVEKRYREAVRNIEYEHRGAFQKMLEQETDFAIVADDAAATLTEGFIDGFTEIAINGKASFAELTAAVLKDISAMIMKMSLLRAVKLGAEMFGINTDISVGAMANGGVIKPYTKIDAGSIVRPYADGGVMVSHVKRDIVENVVGHYAQGGVNKVPKAEMDRGGVKKTPHIALFAEAGVPEAFIPMRDGKSIPISLSRDESGNVSAKALLPGGRSIPARIAESNIATFANGGVMGNLSTHVGSSVDIKFPEAISGFVDALTASTMRLGEIGDTLSVDRVSPVSRDGNVKIEINVENNGASSTKQSGGDTEFWSKVATNVKGVVMKTLAEEKRPGGVLWHG